MKKLQWSRKIETNLLNLYSQRTEQDESDGMLWYARGNRRGQEISKRHGVPLSQVIGVIAVLSPGCEWGRNLLDADAFIAAWNKGSRNNDLPVVGVYGRANMRKAARILQGESFDAVVPKTSPKVTAFYHCLAEPNSHASIVIDRHAKCAAYNAGSNRRGMASNDAVGIVRPSEYEYLAWHYRQLAARLGLVPMCLQAVLWISWRRINTNEHI